MKNQSYFECMKKNFPAFFFWYPLMTLALLPVFFIIYGGSIDNIKIVFLRVITLNNIIKYIGLLAISYFGHVTYGWLNRNTLDSQE